MNKRLSCRTHLCTVSLWLFVPLCISALDVTRAEDTPGGKSDLTAPQPKETPDKGLTRLSSQDQCWVDFKRQLVIVNGKICQRRGLLEMFACPLDTKDHESIVCVYSRAYVIHTALLAVGAIPGSPVKYVPEYESAHGTEVEVFILWEDDKKQKQKTRAQDWIRNAQTKEPMKHPWVFAGSGFWKDDDGNEHYMAEGGELVCVSNFSTAMLDLPVKSSQSNSELLFEPFTERIPPRGTEVRLVLQPKQAQPGKATSTSGDNP